MESTPYPRPQRLPLNPGQRFLWVFIVPAFTGWYTTCFCYMLATSGPAPLTLPHLLGIVAATPLFMALSLLAQPDVLLCLIACAGYASLQSFPVMRILRPAAAFILGYAFFLVLGSSFLGEYIAGMEAEGVEPWPFWTIQYPAAIATGFSAWLSATLLFRRPWGISQVLAEGPSVTEAPAQTVTSPAHEEDRIEA